MRFIIKLICVIALVGLVLVAIFWANLSGYLRASAYCRNDGGAKVFAKFENDVGWYVPGKNGHTKAEYLLHYFPRIKFIRYQDELTGSLIDISRTSSTGNSDVPSPPPAKATETPIYEYTEFFEAVKDELRLSVKGFSVRSLKVGGMVMEYRDYGYRPFENDFGYGGGVWCSTREDKRSSQAPNLEREKQMLVNFKSR